MNYLSIVPAFIPKSEEEVAEMASKLDFSPEIQLDLVDGKFAQTVCWPFDPVGNPLTVKKYLDRYTLEIDLMVENPIEVAKVWEEAGADMLVFHMETLSIQELEDFINMTDCSVGVSAHGDINMEEFSRYIDKADYVQLMGIKEIGAQGNAFDESVLEKISWLRKKFPLLSIGVDGSVNENTIKKIKEAGADRFVCGSAIVSKDNPEEAYYKLGKLIN